MTNPFGNPKEETTEFEIDLTEVTSGLLVPEGKYTGKLIDVEKSMSQAGNPMWVWTFVLTDGKFEGKEFKLYTALTPSAMWKLTETLEALGIGKAGEAIKFDLGAVINTEVVMHITEDEYNGKPRNSLDKISAPANGAGAKFDPKATNASIPF